MATKHFLSLVVLWLFTAGNLRAQEEHYFKRIEHQLDHLDPRSQVDTILAVPYNEMVSDFDYSLQVIHRARSLATENNYAAGQGRASELLGIVHYLKGQYDSSSYYNLEAQRIFASANMQEELGSALASQGYMIKRRNLPEAFKTMKKGINILEKAKSDPGLATAYDNYGVLYEMNNDLDSALYFYSKALHLKESLADSNAIGYSLNNIGGVHILRSEYENALPYLERAYAIRQSLTDAFGIVESQSLFGDLYSKWGKTQEAIDWYLVSKRGCDNIKYPYLKQYNLEQLSKCYERIDRNDLALAMIRESYAIKDSLLNEKNLKQINELELKFKSAEKDKSIAQLEERNLKRRQYITIISSLLLLVALGALLYIQVQKRRARARQDHAIIEERERGLEAVFSATEEERRRIAKDLHDGISQQLSGLRLSFESLSIDISSRAPEQSERIVKLNAILDEACNDVRSISHQMMPKALSEMGLLAAIEDMLNKSLGLSSIHFRLEHFNVEGKRFEEKIELGLFRVCQELVNNIMKHSGANEVVVQLFVSKKHLVMIVEDNGRGFSPGKKEGIGLTNITSRMSTVDGEVSWEPGPEQGTVATVRVPFA